MCVCEFVCLYVCMHVCVCVHDRQGHENGGCKQLAAELQNIYMHVLGDAPNFTTPNLNPKIHT